MKAKMLEQFQFTDELKERLVLMVVFQNQSPKTIKKPVNIEVYRLYVGPPGHDPGTP